MTFKKHPLLRTEGFSLPLQFYISNDTPHRVLIRCHPSVFSTATMLLRYRWDGGFGPRTPFAGDNAFTLSLGRVLVGSLFY